MTDPRDSVQSRGSWGKSTTVESRFTRIGLHKKARLPMMLSTRRYFVKLAEDPAAPIAEDPAEPIADYPAASIAE
jgi:hypothetical protein